MMYCVAPCTDYAFLGSRRILNLLMLQLLKICCDVDLTHELQVPHTTLLLHETTSLAMEESIFVMWRKS